MRTFMMTALAICALWASSPVLAGDQATVDAAVPSLPAPTGTYAVGTRTFLWADPSRPDYVSPERSDKRQIKVQIWYPADPIPGTKRPAYLDAAVLSEEWPERRAQLAAVRVPAANDAAVSTKEARYPLVLFSPGLGMSRSYYTALLTDLASHGYVIAAIDHPYVSVVDLGGHIAKPYAPWNDAPKDNSLRTASEAVRDAYWREANHQLSSDQRVALGELTKLAAPDAQGRFAGRIDLDRVGLMGHSKGFVSLTCSQDVRIKACVNLMSVPAWAERVRGLPVPFMALRDGSESERATQIFKVSREAAFDVLIPKVGHNASSDLPLLIGKEIPGVAESPVAPTRALGMIRAFAVQFFDRYLKDGPAPLLDGTSHQFPEAHVTAYP